MPDFRVSVSFGRKARYSAGKPVAARRYWIRVGRDGDRLVYAFLGANVGLVANEEDATTFDGMEEALRYYLVWAGAMELDDAAPLLLCSKLVEIVEGKPGRSHLLHGDRGMFGLPAHGTHKMLDSPA